MTKRATLAYIKEKYSDKIDWGNLKVTSPYTGNRGSITLQCNTCDNSYSFNRVCDMLARGDMFRCTVCHPKSKPPRIVTIEDFKKFMDTAYNGRFTLLATELDKSKNLRVRCNTCLDEHDVTYKSIRALKIGCRNCNNSKPLTTQAVKDTISNITNGEYTLVGEYVNAQISIEIQHNSDECGSYSWFTMYGNFVRQGRRCPKCTFVPSKGEEAIAKLLTDENIPFEREYVFPDCRNKRVLPFDFAILDNTYKKVRLLVEYDGLQHFSVERGFWGRDDKEDVLEVVQHRDKIKEDYCTHNGIRLLRIPYTAYDNLAELLLSEIYKLD